MPQSLLIAVRFSEGRYHGQNDGFNGADGWPPAPGRLFQALVAAAARGANLFPEDVRALEWLEGLEPPTIAAPATRRGRAVKLFVPNNDLDSVGGNPARVSEIRVGKHWRPCFFNPDEPVLYVWDFESGLAEADRICATAERMYQLGRGIDMAWACGRVLDPREAEALLESHPGVVRTSAGAGEIATPRPGTLNSLVNRYRLKRRRLTIVHAGRKAQQLFRRPPKASFARTGYDAPARRLHFELRLSEGGFAPRPLASVAPVIAGLRDAAAARLQESLPENFALYERLVIGRGAGPADLTQRIRLIPIPSIGAPHTDPSIRRITVEIPPDCPIRAGDLKWAFAGLRPCDPHTGEIWPGILVSTDNSQMADRFGRSGRVFRSITPVALPTAPRRRIDGAAERKDAHERGREERRAAGAVVQALRHTGIQARPSDISVQREPFHRRGVRAELFADGSRFSKHALWHVELRFREALRGPLVIGDGRFCGLGLMGPGTHRTDVFSFELNEEHRVAMEDWPMLIRHLRRALMALARDDSGQVGRLFSGHEADGRGDRAGHHAHVFLAADSGPNDEDAITRLVVAAPWAADRGARRQRGDQRQFEEVIQQLEVLMAGRLGRFERLSALPVEDGDSLLGPATTWVGRTPYVATRNLKKRDDPASVVKEDVVAECARRGLPAPIDIDLLKVSVGPRGGRPAANLKLRFAVAVRGPLLLGRDSHAGGGLFHADSS